MRFSCLRIRAWPLTSAGRKALREHVAALRQLIDAVD